jgi:hypothetical protein
MRALLTAVLMSSVAFAGCNADATTAHAPGTAAAPTAQQFAPGAAPAAATPVSEPADAIARPATAPPSTPVAAIVEEARVREITIPAGTTINLALTSGVSSRSSSVEDPVSATLRRAIVVNGVTVVPAGAAVGGHVSEAARSGRVKGRARIGVRFTSLRAHDARYDMRTAGITRVAPATKKRDAATIGLGAGGGALVGGLAGGKKGALIGTAVGGGAGTGAVLATRGEEVALGRGAVVTTRLTAPLTIRVPVR